MFRTRSVATNLVTSLKFQPIRCASKLCQLGKTPSAYVATRFILLTSTAAGSATSGYVVVRESIGQNEDSACINDDRTREEPSFVPKVIFFDAIVFQDCSYCF